MAGLPLLLAVTFAQAAEGDKDTAPGLSLSVSPDTLRHLVERLVDTPQARHFENIASLDSAAAFVFSRLEDLHHVPQYQTYEVDGRTYRNVTALVGPAGTRRLVIGAHYDVCGDQDGADDNASGVAGMLELARLAQANAQFLKRQIEFVAYSLEEPPFYATPDMGSYVHARSLKRDKVDVEGMIALECIGYYNDEAGSQEYPLGFFKLFYPRAGDFIASVGNFRSCSLVRALKKAINSSSAVPCHSLCGPSMLPGVDFSDHRSYWKHGYRAAMITNTAFYRNRAYHTAGDTVDRLDFRRMAEVVKGVARFMFE